MRSGPTARRRCADTAAAATGRAKPLLANTSIFWALVTMIVVATMMLTGWTAAQASVVNRVIDGNGPEHPSIRQLERQGGTDLAAPHFVSIRQLERAAQQDDVDRSAHRPKRQIEQAEQAWADRLVWMEHNELRRFRNQAPIEARVALDEAIAQLEAPLA